jgi:sulfite reductase alpha subunit-like flavoprotein
MFDVATYIPVRYLRTSLQDGEARPFRGWTRRGLSCTVAELLGTSVILGLKMLRPRPYDGSHFSHRMATSLAPAAEPNPRDQAAAPAPRPPLRLHAGPDERSSGRAASPRRHLCSTVPHAGAQRRQPAMTPAPSPAAPAGPVVHVLYATQTGNAEEIARRIAADLPGARGCPALCLSKYASSPAFAPGPRAAPAVAVFVVATTGDGDVPDAVRPFMRYMRKAVKERALVGAMRYAVLGLGDTNYESFCGGAAKVEAQLTKAGAVSFYGRGRADDGTGMEEVVEPWIEGLAGAVSALFTEIGGAHAAAHGRVEEAVKAAVGEELPGDFGVADLPAVLPAGLCIDPFSGEVAEMESASPHFDFVRTIRAAVVGARLLTGDGSERRVYHLEIDGGDGLAYSPGDAFGVLVENADGDVDRALNAVRGEDKAADDAVVWQVRAVGGARSVLATGCARKLLKERVELRAAPKKTLLRALAAHCANEEERADLLRLAAKPRGKAREAGLQYGSAVVDARLGVLDVIEKYAPSCRPPLALLLDQVVPLAPRYYSAASAPETDGTRLHFAFTLVGGGLATTALAARADAFLAGVDAADIPNVLVIPRLSDANSTFRPPTELDTPYIMVGPGTGVAPFRGFLRQRAALLEASHHGAPAETMLFFGCRHEASDYLYADELRALASSSTLSVLDVAFSRDGTTKTYVQDRLVARGEAVAATLEAGGSLFVCGDGGGMAVGVDKALHALVTEHICDGDAGEGKAYVRRLAKEHRYVRDIWYFGMDEEQ